MRPGFPFPTRLLARLLARSMALCLALAAVPAGAETAEERQERQCRDGWRELTSLPDHFPLTGSYDGMADGWCRFSDIVFVTDGYTPDLQVDAVRLKGEALGLFTLNEAAGPVLELVLEVEGLRIVPQVDQAQMDWLYRAQARAYGISGELAVSWDRVAKVVTLSRLKVDFPGENAVSMTARVAQVDLSSAAAMQMSAASLAVTEATLDVTTHGLFETYLLVTLGAVLLPYDGDVDAGAEALRAAALQGIAALPETTFPAATKDALSRLVQEMPNPSGTLGLTFTAENGFGPARLARYAVTGVPLTVAEAAPLFQGVVVEASWTHEDSPD